MNHRQITMVGLFLYPLSLIAAGEQVVDINIEGMSCKFCAHKIQKELTLLPGVETVSVSIDDKKAHIVMSPGKKANVEQLKKKITASGFTPVETTTETLD